MYKVFFNEKPIFLTDNLNAVCRETSCLFLKHDKIDTLREVLTFFSKTESVKQLNIFHFDIDKLRLDFKQCFKNIDAAGGVVKNDKGEYLLIYRRGKWDLPKGKVDENENFPQAAIREVTEETGLNNIEIVQPLLSTYHTYPLKNKTVLKKTYWYEMKFSGNEKLIPETEEDIEEARWFKESELEEPFKNTFPLIIDIFVYLGVIKQE